MLCELGFDSNSSLVRLCRLDFLTGIVHSLAEDGGEDHLDVLEERIVAEVVEIKADFVREDYLVIVFQWVGLLGEQPIKMYYNVIVYY